MAMCLCLCFSLSCSLSLSLSLSPPSLQSMAEHSVLESRVSELQVLLTKTESELTTLKDSIRACLTSSPPESHS